nr:premnaspirodiene oxygenase-like [Ziziphus jujuba var. spinosa]
MQKVFEISDLGVRNYFLGMEIYQSSPGIFLSQKKYAVELLKKFDMEKCNPVDTPIVYNQKFEFEDGATKIEDSSYRNLIGSPFSWSSQKQDLVAHSTTEAIAFSPFGEFWRQIRKVCISELLSIRKVQFFSSSQEDEVLNLIEAIRSSATGLINLTGKLFSLTSSITCRTAFGNKGQDLEAFISLAKEGIALSGGFNLASLFPSNKFLRVTSRMRAKLEKIHSKADQILEYIILEHK